MKKIFTIIVLAALTLTALAKDSDNISLPEWFLKPSAHTYVGMSEPNGNVHDAINTALIHYLICSNFSGKMIKNSMSQSSLNSRESSSRTICILDTILHYSIEEIVSISNDEYICRISDRPTLSRRIILEYHADSHSLTIGDQNDFDYELFIKCIYEDQNGQSTKGIQEKVTLQNRKTTEYSYTSVYTQGELFKLAYHNVENKAALGEKLITLYMDYLTNGFIQIQEKGEKNAYHKATPFSGFEYHRGHIIIIP